jgi:hypothetical protein
MSEESKPKKKVKHVALKNLATKNGNVKQGQEFECSEAELKVFKKAQAV